MKASERDDLIRYLDNEAGPMPSAVNKAHEDVQYALSRGELGAALMKTIEAEGYNGRVGIVLQTLRDKIAAITVDPEAPPAPPPELPPVTPGPPGTVGTISKGGPVVKFTAYDNTVYSAYCATDGAASWTCGSGNVRCYISFDPACPVEVSQWGSGQSGDFPAKAGQTVYMRQVGMPVQAAIVSMPH